MGNSSQYYITISLYRTADGPCIASSWPQVPVAWDAEVWNEGCKCLPIALLHFSVASILSPMASFLRTTSGHNNARHEGHIRLDELAVTV